METIHQKLVDRVDRVRNGRTWKAIAEEIGIASSRFSDVRWRPGATFGIESYRKIEQWVEQQEEALLAEQRCQQEAERYRQASHFIS